MMRVDQVCQKDGMETYTEDMKVKFSLDNLWNFISSNTVLAGQDPKIRQSGNPPDQSAE